LVTAATGSNYRARSQLCTQNGDCSGSGIRSRLQKSEKLKTYMKTPIQTYATRADALAIKDKLDEGTYYLAHGEHSRPKYSVRKIRGENGYYIHARYYYLPGTFYAPASGPLLVFY
jgi:hypothetical protein